jgi:hypothetical protein
LIWIIGWKAGIDGLIFYPADVYVLLALLAPHFHASCFSVAASMFIARLVLE